MQYQRCCEDLVQVYSKDKLKLQVLLGFVADRVNEKGNCVLCMSHDRGSVKFGNDFQDQVIKVRVSKDGNAVVYHTYSIECSYFLLKFRAVV